MPCDSFPPLCCTHSHTGVLTWMRPRPCRLPAIHVTRDGLHVRYETGQCPVVCSSGFICSWIRNHLYCLHQCQATANFVCSPPAFTHWVDDWTTMLQGFTSTQQSWVHRVQAELLKYGENRSRNITRGLRFIVWLRLAVMLTVAFLWSSLDCVR